MAAGHHVKTVMGFDKMTKKRSHIGDGLIEKIEGENYKPHMGWADLIFTTENTKWLRELDVYRKRGFPVFAPSYEGAQLELDRSAGQKFLEKCGVGTIPFQMFHDYKKAEKYVMQKMERMVSKPNGDKDKALSYVSKSPADMIFMLRQWSDKNKEFGPFMLQDFVEGQEFAVNGWMGKEGFASFIEESFEHKKFMNDDKAMNCGEQGTALKYVQDSALAKEVLLPLESGLIKMGYTGSIDVSVMVDTEGNAWPLEFTARPGWPAFNIVQPLHPDPCEWMGHLLDGEDTFRPLTDHAIGVVVTLPPWPHEKILAKDVSGVPVYNLDDENPYRPFISPCEVMSGTAPAMVDGEFEDNKRLMVSAGAYLFVATGLGDSVREAQREAYKAVDSIEIPRDPQLRTDIGDKAKKAIPVLQEFGFAEDWVV
jgi:phosphoribosylamine--glycine ligase